MLDSSLTWLILIPYLHPYEESFFSHLYLRLCFGAAGRKLIAHNILSWWKHFTRFSGHNLHSGGYKSCAASAAEMASDCYQLAFNAAAQTTRVRKNFTLLCKISSFSLSLRSFSLFFWRFAWCCSAPFCRPSCFLLLIAHSPSFFLSRGDTYLCFAQLSSAHIFPWMFLTIREKTESYPFSSSL